MSNPRVNTLATKDEQDLKKEIARLLNRKSYHPGNEGSGVPKPTSTLPSTRVNSKPEEKRPTLPHTPSTSTGETPSHSSGSNSSNETRAAPSPAFSLEKFLTIVNQKDFSILGLYSEDGKYRFVELLSNESGEKFLVYILSKYPIPVNPNYPSIEVVYYELDDATESGDGLPVDYDEIELKGATPPGTTEAAGEARYKPIDIEKESTGRLNKSIQLHRSILDRVKSCTSKVKYKLAVITGSFVCFINRHNEVECFTIKGTGLRSDPLKQETLIMIDIESFYEKINALSEDVHSFYKKLYLILNKAHLQQIGTLREKTNEFGKVADKAIVLYDAIQSHVKTMNKLSSHLKVINTKYSEMSRQRDDVQKGYTPSSRGHSSLGERKVFRLSEIEGKLGKLRGLRSEVIGLYQDVKNKYNRSLLDYDNLLFMNSVLLDSISKNCERLKV